MVRSSDFVIKLSSIDKEDVLYVGGKAANLGEMIRAGFPVPGGFAVTAHAYREFLKFNQLDKKIEHLLGTVNYSKDESLNQVASHIKRIITSSKVPENIVNDIFSSYEKLGKNVFVAVRSSATSEDSKEASFAGQNETYLNVSGEASVVENIRKCWASLFESRSIYYRHEKKIPHSKAAIAIVVQRMVESDSSGIMFTVDPVTNDKEKVVIEAVFGLGEYIVQGTITPDHYEIDKKTLEIENKKTAKQTIKLSKVRGQNKKSKVSIFSQNKQKISDSEIIELAKLGVAIEKHYYFPQDIEWSKEKGKIYIVQTRPITTLQRASEKASQVLISTEAPHKPIFIGEPASPGIGIGPIRVINSKNDLKKLKPGEVLVAKYTSPDYVPYMKKSSAILTEMGGRTSHAAIVSREFGLPAVVGIPALLKSAKEGAVVTVNGAKGEVYAGSIAIASKKTSFTSTHLKTATKVYVNLAEPELAEELAKRNVDGVGLLRAEFMVAQIGIHPKKLIDEGKSDKFVSELSTGIEKICKAFYPRPVIYRATDFKTNEYRSLIGGKHFEPEESNPMLGYRGAFRYISDPKVFNLELDTVRHIREKKGLNNLQLMIPFVRTVKEMQLVKNLVSKKIKRSHTFKLFMMCEIPSNVLLIDEFIDVGIDGVSIGSNDLTMLILGTDRDNQEVAPEFDERNPAVMKAFETVIKSCIKHKIPVSICGQAPSNYPSLVQDLVKWGVTSISVSPDAIDSTREHIFKAEKEILNK